MELFVFLYLVTVVTGEGPVISVVQRTGATTTLSCVLPNATSGICYILTLSKAPLLFLIVFGNIAIYNPPWSSRSKSFQLLGPRKIKES